MRAILVDMVECLFSGAPTPSAAFGARNFHAASRRRQVRVGSGVSIGNLDVTTADVVIFVRRQCRRCGGRLCFLRRLRRWLF
jgi:hypothetical protein